MTKTKIITALSKTSLTSKTGAKRFKMTRNAFRAYVSDIRADGVNVLTTPTGNGREVRYSI